MSYYALLSNIAPGGLKCNVVGPSDTPDKTSENLQKSARSSNKFHNIPYGMHTTVTCWI